MLLCPKLNIISFYMALGSLNSTALLCATLNYITVHKICSNKDTAQPNVERVHGSHENLWLFTETAEGHTSLVFVSWVHPSCQLGHQGMRNSFLHWDKNDRIHQFLSGNLRVRCPKFGYLHDRSGFAILWMPVWVATKKQNISRVTNRLGRDWYGGSVQNRQCSNLVLCGVTKESFASEEVFLGFPEL